MSQAAHESFSSWQNPLASVVIASPFIAAELLLVEVARYSNRIVAAVLFAFVLFALVSLYYAGYAASQEAMLRHKWTAAELSIGLLPMYSLPILAVAVLAGEIIRRRYKHET